MGRNPQMRRRSLTAELISGTVDAAAAVGAAGVGYDYTAASGTLTFAAGETLKRVSITLEKPREPVSLDRAMSDGAATAGDKHTAAWALTPAAGGTGATVQIASEDGVIDEGPETFTLGLSNPQPAGRLRLAAGRRRDDHRREPAQDAGADPAGGRNDHIGADPARQRRPSADNQLTREGPADEPAALRGGCLDGRTVEPVAPAAERPAPATDPRALEVAQAGSEPAGAAGPVPQPGADP